MSFNFKRHIYTSVILCSGGVVLLSKRGRSGGDRGDLRSGTLTAARYPIEYVVSGSL